MPLLAGLAGGLARQTKLTFALPVLVLIGAWIIGGGCGAKGDG